MPESGPGDHLNDVLIQSWWPLCLEMFRRVDQVKSLQPHISNWWMNPKSLGMELT